MTRGKSVRTTLKDKSWKATGQEMTKTAGSYLPDIKGKVKAAGEKVDEFIEDRIDAIKDAGDWLIDKFSIWK